MTHYLYDFPCYGHDFPCYGHDFPVRGEICATNSLVTAFLLFVQLCAPMDAKPY